MNSKTIFILILLAVCLAACGRNAVIFTPNSSLATSTLDVTAKEVDVETSTGIFQTRTAGDWILYRIDNDFLITYITAFTFDQNGSVWLGNDDVPKHLIHLDLNSGSYTDYALDRAYDITNIVIAENGEIWVGSSTYRFKDGKWTYFGEYVLEPRISPDHSIWVYSLNSLDTNLTACPARYDQDKWTRFCPPFKDDTALMSHFSIDNTGNIWLSTRNEDDFNQGVWKLSSAGWQLVEELSNDKERPYIMAQGNTGDMWFFSSIYRYEDTSRIKKIDGTDWLLDIENPDVLTHGFQVDKNNMLWAEGSCPDPTEKMDDCILRLNNNNQWEKVVSLSELVRLWGPDLLQIYTFGFSPSGNLCLGTSIGFMCKTK
jgi:streptogramin lyase